MNTPLTKAEARAANKLLEKFLKMSFTINERDNYGQVLIFSGVYVTNDDCLVSPCEDCGCADCECEGDAKENADANSQGKTGGETESTMET